MGHPSYSQISAGQLPESPSSSNSSDDSNDPLLLPSKEFLESPVETPELLLELPSTRKRRKTQTIRALRFLLHIATWVFVGSFLLWALTALFSERKGFKASIRYLENNTLVHNDTLPAKALPVAVTDAAGKNRWTVSIPPYQEFPLGPGALEELCGDSHELAHHLDMIEKGHGGHFGYYHVDEKFMEVSEAQHNVFLPPSIPAHHESVVRNSNGLPPNGTYDRDPKTGTCKRSLTYVLESNDAGFGSALMGLWLAYGLAMKEGRAFFIDDRKWAYGTYTTFFTHPPSPFCLPPPETQRLPCPHHTAHLLVSSATTHWTFGHAFNEEFEDPRGMEVQRQKPIFTLMREGYEALFHLARSDDNFIQKRVSAIRDLVAPGMSVGLHVRRGDKKPYDQRFAQHGNYVPSEGFVRVANKVLIETFVKDTELFDVALNHSRMVLASDDPAVYEEWEFRGQERAQDQVVLATELHDIVNVTSTPGWTGEKVMQGWEGGFYQKQFWNMSSTGNGEGGWWGADSALKERQLMARTYVLDIAVLSQMDRVICTVSATGCRLLAVMMGWEEAIEQGKWMNVDGDWDWKGIRWA